MKQRINLCVALPTKQKVSLSFYHIVQICSIFFGVLLLIYGINFIYKIQLTVKLNNIKKELRQYQGKLVGVPKKYSKELAIQKVNTAKLKTIKKEVQTKQRLINAFGTQGLSGAQGFSVYFEELSKQIVSNVWLTGFQLSDGGNDVVLNGVAFREEDVLAFLKKLHMGQSSSFKKIKLMSLVSSKKDEKNQADRVHFVMKTANEKDVK